MRAKPANRCSYNTHTQVNIKEEIKNTADTKRTFIEIVGAAISRPKKSEIIPVKVEREELIELFVEINQSLTILRKLDKTNYIRDG